MSPYCRRSIGLGQICLLWDKNDTGNRKKGLSLYQKGSKIQPYSLKMWRQSVSVWFDTALITCSVIMNIWAATWLRHIHMWFSQIPTTVWTVGPQSTWVSVKKGITSPSRGFSQHCSHTYTHTHISEQKNACHALPRYSQSRSLFSTSGFKQPQQDPVHNHSESHQQQLSPPFTAETFIHCLMRLRTIAPHARSLPASMQYCWGENEGRERQIAERMREDKYLTHR